MRALVLRVETDARARALGVWGALTGLAAVVFLAAFAAIERRAEAPLVPFAIFRSPTLRYANIATLFMLGRW